jgi:hypothetical protein
MSAHDPNPHDIPDKTSFRRWMELLNSPRGATPEWPLLVREMLHEEFCHQRKFRRCYAGEVFKDKDRDDPTLAKSPEKRKVRDLYHLCLRQTDGCLRIGNTPYWLLGYEWPNQGHHRMRRADLVGLTAEGGLAVFECKVERNSNGPFAAVLEGLDYLTCLTSEANFEKIRQGFARWRNKARKQVPPGFDAAAPKLACRHEIIVLAPKGYFELYRQRSGRGSGSPDFAKLAAGPATDPLLIRFAETEYLAAVGTWVTG